MNMYKFGNYICKLREEKNLTQAELAHILNVTDKSVSKWENGQAFPRIETFENLAEALGTTVEDIYGASKDGVDRVCIVNNFCSVMHIDVDGKPFAVAEDESKWIEITSDTISITVTGELFVEEWEEPQKEKKSFFEKRKEASSRKALEKLKNLFLQADCIYKISHLAPESFITVKLENFNLGDKMLTYYDFQICYPKLMCADGVEVELVNAKGKNTKEVIRRYKKLGLMSDLGLTFIQMIISYPIRGLYFKHLCKNRVLKKNILNADAHKQKAEKREKKSKKYGCLLCTLAFVLYFALELFVFPAFSVKSDKPYLLSEDYSTITYNGDVYTRIEELPEGVMEQTFFGAEVWMDVRTEGRSRWEQASQDDKVKLYVDDNGREYLWLVENYSEFPSDAGYDYFEKPYFYAQNGD